MNDPIHWAEAFLVIGAVLALLAFGLIAWQVWQAGNVPHE